MVPQLLLLAVDVGGAPAAPGARDDWTHFSAAIDAVRHIAPASQPPPLKGDVFRVFIDGVALECTFEKTANAYGTQTTTTTNSSLWHATGSSGVSGAAGSWSLSYARINEREAQGGRCVTGLTSALSGDGVLSSELYIDHGATSGTGVFTINAEATPFSKSTEMDLFVVNLEHGRPSRPPSVIESGKPGHTTSYPTLSFEGRWLRWRMVKVGTSCNTTVVDVESGATVAVGKPTEQCALAPQSHLTINARGRDGSDARETFVLIRNVTWQSNKNRN